MVSSVSTLSAGLGATAAHRMYKYKLKPTPEQARLLAYTLLLCRRLYNTAIQQRRMLWLQRGVSTTYYRQKAELPDLKDSHQEYRDIHSQVAQDVLLRVERAFVAFYNRLRAGEKAGYPRYQGAGRYTSFTYPQVGNGVRLDNNGYVVLSKIGRVAVHRSRSLQGTPKTATIIREADGWYISFACEGVQARPLPLTGREVGIDLGLKVFLMRSDGVFVENPRYYRAAEKVLKKAHRCVSRRKRGSKRRAKAIRWLARKYQKVRRQRRDYQHKTALALVREFDAIFYENLGVANLMRNAYLAKSISDAAWGRFCTVLASKAACAGKRVIHVSPAYTSQLCSNPDCGQLVPKGLSVRWHRCPHCGTVLDRDENAALNILRKGHILLAEATRTPRR